MSGPDVSRWPKGASRWRRPEFISNLSSFVLTGAMAAGVLLALPEKLASAPEPPPREIQLALLDPNPDEPRPEEPRQDVAAEPPPETQVPEPPPPKPAAKAELTTPEGALPPPKKRKKKVAVVQAPDDDDEEEEAPKPKKKVVVKPKPKPRQDHDEPPRRQVERRPARVAGAPRAERQGPVAARAAAPRASAGSAAAFRSCLQGHARYPTSKEARQQNPHGAVGVSVSLSGSSIVGVSVTSSSGSSILDQAARASVLSSGCGSSAGGAPHLTGRIVF